MSSFVNDGVTTFFVSPPGFDSVKGIDHRSDEVAPLANQLGFFGHFLSLIWYLIVLRPDRFVPFNILGGFVGALVGLFISSKTILFIRGDFYRGRSITGGFRARLIRQSITWVEWVTFRLVDHVVFISEHNRRMMLRRTGLDRSDIDSTVLYNNTFTNRVIEQLDDNKKSLEESPVVGFAGEFPSCGTKGVSDLIDAVALLSDSYPDLHLYLLGRGDGERSLRRQARRQGIEDRVHFLGWVENPIRYMQAFDLYILPSYHEGLGNSLLEALAADTPIAGSDVGGIPEVVYNRNYLFQPGDPSAMADVIADIFATDSAYQRAIKNCKERRKAFDFDWTEIAKDIVICGSTAEESDRIPPIPIPDQLGAFDAKS